MALRQIVQVGDSVLRKKCFEVTDFGIKTQSLIDDMKQTLDKADGAGLAAPQVGVLRRIFIVKAEGQYFECVNPVMIKQSGKQVGNEGCLSVKNRYGVVERPMKITLKALDRFGKPFKVNAEGFVARAFCHEYDHLDGILYIDKASKMMEEKD